jgi:Raf kinase inhibitor-like YbhB/YbcL family protein
MKVTSDTFRDHGAIPARCAFCAPDAKTHATLGENRNPHLAWSGLPPGTQSLALVCHDPDVPSKPDDVNQESRSIPKTLPRVAFYHWLLVDLKPDAAPLKEGELSSGVTSRGKSGPNALRGTRQGLNDYTAWFAADKDMAGEYFGYDGPCPPWNDSIVHHYVFTLYALDVGRCPVQGKFRGADLLKAIQGRVLGKAALTGLYSLNPVVKI